jgi:hypothetical protein
MTLITKIVKEQNFGCGLIARTDLTRPFHVDFGYTGCFAVVTPKQHEQGALDTNNKWNTL